MPCCNSIYFSSHPRCETELNSHSLSVLVHGAHQYLCAFWASAGKWRWLFFQYTRGLISENGGLCKETMKVLWCPGPWSFWFIFLQNLLKHVVQSGLCLLALWVISSLSSMHLISSTGIRPIHQLLVKCCSFALFKILIKIEVLVSGIQWGSNAENGIWLDLMCLCTASIMLFIV